MAAKGARMTCVRVLSKRLWTAVGLPWVYRFGCRGFAGGCSSQASVCVLVGMHASLSLCPLSVHSVLPGLFNEKTAPTTLLG
jgi:hypothetical protein